MSSRPVITIRNDEVTIDADYLAEKLGLSTDRLRAEMRRGIVYGLVERGVGNDAGRLRLTFRYRVRSWTVVVQPGGTLDEVAAARPARRSADAESGVAVCRAGTRKRSKAHSDWET
jgi:hypothetical protein